MGPLIEVKGNLNSQLYISNILEPFQIFWRKFRRNKKPPLFMQDNAPCHTAKIVDKWFGLKKKEIGVASTITRPINTLSKAYLTFYSEM